MPSRTIALFLAAGVSAVALLASFETGLAQSVTVEGDVVPNTPPTTSWTVGPLAVGNAGTGSLRIGEGGTVFSGEAVVGRSGSSTGTVFVTGPGSLWNIDGFLTVAQEGNSIGELIVDDGAVVEADSLVIGEEQGSRGTVRVGRDAVLRSSRSIFISHGTLTLAEGGMLTSRGTMPVAVVIGPTSGSGTAALVVGSAPGSDPIAAGRLGNIFQIVFESQGSVVFNHTGNEDGSDVIVDDEFVFDGVIRHRAGNTVLTGRSPNFDGAIELAGGTLVLDQVQAGEIEAAGTAQLILNGGVLLVRQNGALRNSTIMGRDGTLGTIAAATGTTLDFAPVGLSVVQGVFGSADHRGTIVLSGNNTTSGTLIRVGGGTLRAGDSRLGFLTRLSPLTQIDALGTLDFAGQTGEDAEIANLQGEGTLVNSAGATTRVVEGSFAGSIAGAGDLRKVGTGVLTLSGANTLTGATTIEDGTLALSGSGSLSQSAVEVETVLDVSQVDGGTRVRDLSGAGVVRLGSAILDIADSGSTFAGRFEDGGLAGGVGGGVTLQDGTLTLTGRSTHTGETRVEGGALVLSGSGAIEASSALKLATGAVFRVTDAADGTAIRSLGDTIEGAAGLVEIGGGTLTLTAAADSFGGRVTGTGGLAMIGGRQVLTGANTAEAIFSGSADVTGGTLLVDGVLGDPVGNSVQVDVSGTGTLGGSGTIAGQVAIASGGTLSAGNSPGTLTIAGDVALGSGSRALFELGAPGVVGGTDNDLVRVGGDLTVDTGSTLALQNPADAGAAVTSGFYALFDVAGTTTGRFGPVTNGGAAATADVRQVVTNPGGAPSQFNILVANGGQVVQFWDGAGQNPDGTVDGGTGTWSAAATNWTNEAGTFNDSWRSQVGVFSGTPGTVSVDGTQSVEGLQFTVDGYALAGGSLNLAGNAVGSNGRSFVTVDTGAAATIASTLTGAGGLFKQGGGGLVLSGTNTYTGGTELAGGALSVAADANLGDASSRLVFSGGTLSTTGTFTSARDVTIASTGTISTATGVVTTLSGAIAGAGALTTTGTGNVVLTAANSYTGGTVVAGGGLTLASGGSLASGVDNASVFTNDGTVAGAVTNTGTATNNGTISNGVTNDAVFTQSGILTGGVGNAGSFTQDGGSIAGGVNNSGAFTVSAGSIGGAIANTGGFTSAGTVGADGTFSNTGSGTLTVSAGSFTGLTSLTNESSATAGVSVASGANLSTGAFAGTNAAAVANVDGTLSFADAPYAGLFTGSGRIEQRGGDFTASASNDAARSFSGVYDLSGTMNVTGTFGDVAGNAGSVNVLSGGRLTGTGTMAGSVAATGGSVDGSLRIGGSASIGAGGLLAGTPSIGGDLSIGSGGTLSPGNSPGTINVAGNASFAAGSTYLVETVPGTGVSDRLAVGGTATIGGGQVRHIGLDGAYRPGEVFTILTAAGGVSGAFEGVSSVYTFLDPSLQYAANAVTLTLERNDTAFASVAGTPNQRAAAGGLGSTGFTNAAFNAVATLGPDAARAAFGQLSGEGHASVRGALVDDSRHLRDAVSSRVDEVFSVVEQGSDGGRSIASGPWISGFGSFGQADGDGNAADADRDTGGVFLGAEIAVGQSASLGLFGGYSHTAIDVDARRFSADVDAAHIGAYGAAAFGAIEVSAGAAHSWNDVDAGRGVAFAGFANNLSASYDADVSQVFGEIGYRAELGGVAIKPFAGFAHVHLDADGFAEQGGAARLAARGGSSDTTFTTLGLRASHAVSVVGREVLARGMVGWRHASGDRTPSTTLAFDTGSPFTVQGAAISRNAAVVEAGFAAGLTPNVSLNVDYVGQFGEDTTDNGFRLGLSARF